MLERILYTFGVVIIVILINALIEPYLYQLDFIGAISESQYHFYLWSFHAAVTIGLAIIVYIYGKQTDGVKQISLMIALNALLDLYRVYKFPNLTLLSGAATMFTGVFILGYAYVIKKRALFKKRSYVYFLLLGPIYLLRFPFFVDLIFVFSTTVISQNRAGFFLDWNIYLNYLIIIIQILVLDSFLREKQIIKHIRERMKYKHKIYDIE